MTDASLPYRPRVADHVVVRRHLVDGDDRIALLGGGSVVVVGPEEWAVLAHADGTRDLDGVLLAAAREDAYLPAARLREVLSLLVEAGMLADGTRTPRPPPAAPPTPPDRPLDPLPGYAFTCDGTGGCCRQYASIRFSPEEARRARVLVPDVLDGGARAFLPVAGSASRDQAVALVDGHCAYLAEDGRCAIHAAGGALAKPTRCRLFPTTLVDDGEVVRVSASVECSCVVASAGGSGDPLVPAGARVAGDLEPGTPIRTIPREVKLGPGVRAPRAAVVPWSRRLLGLACPDAARGFWALARAVTASGLDPDASGAALADPPALDPTEVAPLLAAVVRAAAIGRAADEAYKSPHDRGALVVRWVHEAAEALAAPAALDAACRGAADDPAAERLYLAATLHGHHAVGEVAIPLALRDRALRVLLARSLPAAVRRSASGDVAERFPLCAVEVAMRGHGVADWVRAFDGA